MNKSLTRTAVHGGLANCGLTTGRRGGRRAGARAKRPRGRRLAHERLEDRTLLSAGDLDPTFGDGGLVTTSFGPLASLDEGHVVAIQSDGKIVVAGRSASGTGTGYDFALARYNSDGSLDTTFGIGGKVTTDFAGRYDAAHGVAIQPDGRIVAAGYSEVGGMFATDFVLARYNTDGTLDTTFDLDGKVITDFGNGECAYDVAIDSDGHIVVVGYSYEGDSTQNDFAVARYNADGSLDTSFDGDGKVSTDFGSNADMANGVAIGPDGKIVVVGRCWRDGTATDFALARYRTDGSLDTTFGSDGKLTTDFYGLDEAQAVAIDAAGKLVVAGYSTQSDTREDFALARYNSNGSLDTRFGAGGKVTTNIGYSSTDYPYTFDYAYGIAIDAQGQIVVAGYSVSSVPVWEGGAGSDFAVARYNPDGTLETAFDGDGKVTTDFGGPSDVAYGVAIDAAGRIVAAGYCRQGSIYTDFAVARYDSLVEFRPVEIDVKPGSDPNSINLAANGLIAVAILTTQDFNASLVDASTVVFAGASAVHSAMEDTDGDGDLDLVLHFRVEDTNLADIYAQLLAEDLDEDGILDSNHQTTEVSLIGQTATDEYFQGFDDVDLFLSGKNLRELLEDLAEAGVI